LNVSAPGINALGNGCMYQLKRVGNGQLFVFL